MIENERTLAELSSSRAAAYGLLARLCRSEVDADLLMELKAARFPVPSGSELMDKGYRLIDSYVSAVEDDTEDCRLTELAVDFSRVFIGLGTDGHSAAYPFESVYTSEKRLIMQKARTEVAAAYRSAHVAALPTWKEGEDHIAAELEFMQILCMRDDELAESLATQRSFLQAHLLVWAPLMAADMRRFAKTDFYRGLACLLEGFLILDGELLDLVAPRYE